jgi:hypothetical protein
MDKDKSIKKVIKQIILTVDSMDEIELMTQFIQMNRNSHLKEFEEILHKASKEDDFEKQYDLISQSTEKFVLRKKKPISSMLLLLKEISNLIDTLDPSLIIENNEDDKIIFHKDCHRFLKIMIHTCIMGIEKKDEAIIIVDYNNSKEFLLKAFEKMLSDELPQSPIYNQRRKNRQQSKDTLRNYLKVWLLKNLGIEFEDIALIIYKDKGKKSTVYKQFQKARELIFGNRYDENGRPIMENFDKKSCEECPHKDSCTELCPEKKSELKNLEGKQKELSGGIQTEWLPDDPN